MFPTVLIADDSPAFREIIKVSLEMWAGVHSFVEAADGDEAIERVKESKPDLVILDLSMPHMNGVDAANVLKSMIPEVPLVLCTVHDMPGESAEEFGFAAVFCKLDGLRPLADCVATLLRGRAAAVSI